MKNIFSFFIKRSFVNVFALFVVCSGIVSGQERRFDPSNIVLPEWNDSLLHILPDYQTDTVLSPSLLLSGDMMPSDSIPELPDSLRHRLVVRLADPLDSLTNRIFAYNVLSRNSYSRMQVVIDTTLYRFDTNNPVMRNYYTVSHLGNLGLSYIPINFNARKRPSDYLFLDNVAIYLHDPEETTYYQTQFPYTHIDFSSAGPKRLAEVTFNLLHTQNVNKNLNVGLYYDIFTSNGQYVNQNASNSAISLFSAYRGNQYEMYSNFNWNNVRMRENGGLDDLEDFFSRTGEDTDPSNLAVRSITGRTIMLNRSFYLLHSFSPPKISFIRNRAENDTIDASRFALVHTLKYEWNTREYIDNAIYPLQGQEPYFWGTAENTNTYDSLYFRRFLNRFEILLREQPRHRFTAGLSGGVLIEMDRYNTHIIPRISEVNIDPHVPQNSGWGGVLPLISGFERTVDYRETREYVNTALTGSFFNHTGRFLNWDINGRLYFTGHKTGDVNIDGNVRIHYFTPNGRNTLLLGGSIDNVNPGYFLNNYASNLIYWNNNFDLSQEVRLRGEFIMPAHNLKLGAYISQLNNYIYFNKDAKPEQTSELLMTGTAYVEKDIRLWHLGFRFRLYGQYSSNEAIIPLPAFAGYQSTYFEGWLVKNVLNMQLGWNIVYTTKYFANAYMPATGMFHLQDEQLIGNYPFFDFFLNFQLNRARVSLKTDGLNAVLYNAIGRNNFMAYRYPTNEFRMKLGVSWAFYN